jgi:CRP-like cAMP-binding protein
MLIDDIKKFDIFAELEEIEIKKFLQFAQVKQYAKDEIIFLQGDPGSGLFLILKGVIEIYIEPGGNKISLVHLKAGEFMGEMSLFGDGTQKRTASAMAAEPMTAVMISTLDFRRLQSSGPKILSKLLLRLVMGLSDRYQNIKNNHRQILQKIEALKAGAA